MQHALVLSGLDALSTTHAAQPGEQVIAVDGQVVYVTVVADSRNKGVLTGAPNPRLLGAPQTLGHNPYAMQARQAYATQTPAYPPGTLIDLYA